MSRDCVWIHNRACPIQRINASSKLSLGASLLATSYLQ
jgi:hypothetical protein